jgi:hypothetical protein
MGPDFRVKLDAKQVRAALKALKAIDETIVKDLKTDLKGQLTPIARQVADAVPVSPPLSGFANAGATGWTKVTGKTSFTPGRSRYGGASSLVSIRVAPPKNSRGIYIAELAGSRTLGATGAGQNLIAVLNQRQPMIGRGGRYIYAKFRMLRPDVVRIAEGILDSTFKKLETFL